MVSDSSSHLGTVDDTVDELTCPVDSSEAPKSVESVSKSHQLCPDKDGYDVEAVVSAGTTLPVDTSPKEEFERAVDVSEAEIRLIMLAVVLSLTVCFLDAFVLSPALPVIAVELRANDASYAWIASSLLFTMAVSVPILGKASDVFGRRHIMILTNLIFLLGTFIGGFAQSVAMLIAGRAIQGIGCGGLTVVASICVMDLFSPRNRGVYFSLIGTVSAVASAVGPVLGGVLATKATWRWCFWINIPISVISFILMAFFLKLPRPQKPVREGLSEIDWLGAFALTTSVVLFLVGLQLGGGQFPWTSAAVLCPIVLGIALFLAFIFIESRIVTTPLIPLTIFLNRSRAATISVMISQAIVSSGAKTFLVLYFQLVLGTSALTSAIYYLPYAIGLSLILPSIGWIIKRTGKYRVLLLSGSLILALGSGLLIDGAKPTRDWPLIIVPQVLLTMGVGLTYQSSTIAFQAQIKQTEGTAGQSAFQLLRNFSQMLSVILGQVVFQSQLYSRLQGVHAAAAAAAAAATATADSMADGSGGSGGFDAGFAQQIAQGNAFASLALIERLSADQITLVHELLAASFRDMWVFYTVVGGLGVIAAFGIVDVHMA